jgi:ABC-type transporter Mla maintaining outer membrane lipid asymmetry ATPase subunit MlaF
MKFTDAQKDAIKWPPGNLQLIACAGSGKTEVVAQRVAALLVTHRLQDAFMLATHRFNLQANQMERIANDGIDPNTTIMVLKEGRIAFTGSLVDLLRCKDPYIQEYLA